MVFVIKNGCSAWRWSRRFMRLLLAAVVCCQIFRVSMAAAQTKVRVNWGAISGVMSGIWVAQDEGVFKKHGLEVELLPFPQPLERFSRCSRARFNSPLRMH
jgi:ABC-type nitrate/sulfonate/bicarbonate transport system substrate-binding protein